MATDDNDDAVLRVVAHAQQLNAAIDVARLERMRFIYRSWIASAASVAGGFSLTRDELECVLEFPASSAHVDFLMATFRASAPQQQQQQQPPQQIDLLTLLAACACLARGPLEAKAKFLFTLVDFDTEDEIVEDELALLIALCNDGLQRLGVVVTELADVDARALACEAFEFVDVEDGSKMTQTQFVRWLVSHWRPAALFDRIQSLFLISQVAQRLHDALRERQQATVSNPFHVYNTAHFDENMEAESTRVVVGPIVGPVTSSEARILLEVDKETTVQIFAFRVDPGSRANLPDDSKCHSVQLEAWSPQVIVLEGLRSGQTYQLRLLGVCKRDRERCVAIATTPDDAATTSDGAVVLDVDAINHAGIGASAEAYRRIRQRRLRAADDKAPRLTVHFAAMHLPHSNLTQAIDLLCGDAVSNAATIVNMLRQNFRDQLNRPELFDALRVGSNLLVCSRLDILSAKSSGVRRHQRANLLPFALDPWRSYIGMLWGIESDDDLTTIYQGECCMLLKFNKQQREGGHAIAQVLSTLTSTKDLILVTTDPIIPVPTVGSSRNEEGFDLKSDIQTEWEAEEITLLTEWKRELLARNVCLVSQHPDGGFHSRYSIKNTTIAIEQVVAGPASGQGHCAIAAHPVTRDLADVIVSTSAPTTMPHYVTVRRIMGTPLSRPSSQIPSSRPTSRSAIRSSQGAGALLTTHLVGEICRVSVAEGVRILAGPTVAMASERTAAALIESDEDAIINVRLVDRFTSETLSSSHKLRRHWPTKIVIKDLIPGRSYHVSLAGERRGLVQTLCREPASLRILVVADDAFCDLPTTRRLGLVPGSAVCQMDNIRNHLIRQDTHSGAGMMYDMTIHLGSLATLQNHLLHGHRMLYDISSSPSMVTVKLEEMIRRCYRSYVAIPDVQSLRSTGPNWFSTVGIIRGLIQRDAPVLLLRAVMKVMQEYEESDTTLDRHKSQLVHRLANQVIVVKLDTTDCIVSRSSPAFIEWPEKLLTARQLSAVEHALPNPGWQLTSSASRQVILLCDAPFVWPFTLDKTRRRKEELDKVREIASDPWFYYPSDLRQLIKILFKAITTDPLLRITLLSKGPFAARVLISETQSGRSLEQLSLGPISNVDAIPPVTVRYTPERSQNVLGNEYSISGHAVGGMSISLKQYCILDIVPHVRGAACSHVFYTAGRPEARIILGPIIGRVTARTARLLIEIDRPVTTLSCILSSPGHSISTDCAVEAFTPTILKFEGLHPGTRYTVRFEGLLTDQDDVHAHVETPTLLPLSVEWLVFSRNNLNHFLLPVSDSSSNGCRDKSHWHRILSPETRSQNVKSASIVSNRNKDTLGEPTDQQSEQFNPWYHVEAFALSAPLRPPNLSVHVGGQVDLSDAFQKEELCKLVVHLCDTTIGEERRNELYASVRFRLQEVYRTAWGVEPMRTILAYSSNAMLLDDKTDLFFSPSRILECVRRSGVANDMLADDQVSQVAVRLRATAFELWQLYQNQLTVDVNESDFDNSRRNSSKFASHLTLGMCRFVFANVSDELRDVCSNLPSIDQERDPRPSDQVSPLPLPSTSTDTSLALFSSATWKSIDEALDVAVAESAAPQKGARLKTKQSSAVKQLVVFMSIDILEIVSRSPAIRPEIVRLLEKLFHWKLAAREERRVHLVCASDTSSSACVKVTDEKINESLELARVSSISELKEAQTAKAGQTKKKAVAKSTATMKGYFSKRFTYESALITTGSGAASAGTRCRSYASYLFLSDYRRGFLNESVLSFPSRVLPKILLGPVVGRFGRNEAELPPSDTSDDLTPVTSFSVPILVEINSPARLTCVVVDSMVNSETRVTRDLQADQPTVFCIHGLVPLRRYVYFFEGVANGDSRRGCFHTPPSESNRLNLVAVSSNFPTQMDEEQDSLWVPLLERAKLPWCGLDAILHVGGQVPLHEAAIECYEWTMRELQREILHGDPKEVEAKRTQHVRARVRRRFQQEYRICWNVPNIRELLAHVSHWFVHSKADIAPFFGRECPGPTDALQVTKLVVDVAEEVVEAYQLQLMKAIDEELRAASDRQAMPFTNADPATATESSVKEIASAPEVKVAPPDDKASKRLPEHVPLEEPRELLDDTADAGGDETADTGGAHCWQHEEIALFVCDLRRVSTAPNESDQEPITCNGRLSRPLSRQENPIMGEKQWRYLERILRKKRTLLLLLCMEVPLILTNAAHVDKLREELRPTQAHSSQWKLYDHTHVLQHWVACKRQLEQLLLILFKWKTKRRGRDVLVLSGGMRIGIDTMLQDRATKLSLRNFTVGPVTANVELFECPLSGVACPTFGGGVQDDHFTFHHTLLAKKNYLLVQVSVDTPADDRPQGNSEGKAAIVVADFVPNEPAALARLHPVTKFQRFPRWWTTYVPMGKAVFWDDTITLKSETDERMLALREYVWHDRGFAGALEVFYETYQFAETARMEELRSRHLQHVDLCANFVAVLADLWRAIPDSKRQHMAYFLDPFVRELLLAHVAPDLFTARLSSGEPIELAFFSRVLRAFVFDACLLRLTLATQHEDEVIAHNAAVAKRKRDAALAAEEKQRAEQAAQDEAERMAALLRSDPLQYATLKLAQEEAENREKRARQQAKRDRKKAERLAELEEEQAIAKEQKKLNKLAERDAVEYERRQHALDARIRKLEEKRAQRAAQKKAAAEKAAQEAAASTEH